MSVTTQSLEAYRELSESGLLSKSQHVVLQGLKKHGPCTASELTSALLKERGGAPDPSYQKRLSELASRGLADQTGSRACRVTGRTAKVWQAKDSTLRVADDSPLPGHSGPVVSAGPSFKGERRYRDESSKDSRGAVDGPLAAGMGAGVHSARAANPSGEEPRPGAESGLGGALLDFRCPCGRASAARQCACGVVWCGAEGHAKHVCGARS